MVVGHIAGVVVLDVPRLVRIGVPNRETLPILVPSALDLVGRSAGAPEEAGWKSARCLSLERRRWTTRLGPGLLAECLLASDRFVSWFHTYLRFSLFKVSGAQSAAPKFPATPGRQRGPKPLSKEL